MDKPRLVVDNIVEKTSEERTKDGEAICGPVPKDCAEALYNAMLQVIDASEFLIQAGRVLRTTNPVVEPMLQRAEEELQWARKSATKAFQAAVSEREALMRRLSGAKPRAPRRGP